MSPERKSQKKNTSAPIKKIVEKSKKRRPKGFSSIPLDTVFFMMFDAMATIYFSSRYSDEELADLLQNPERDMRPEFESDIKRILDDAASRVCLASIFDEIKKTKRSNVFLVYSYFLARLLYMASGKLEGEDPTPLENDEIMEQSFQQAICSSQKFREYAEKQYSLGEDHFNSWYRDQRKDCLYEFRRLRSKIEKAILYKQALIDGFYDATFDKK